MRRERIRSSISNKKFGLNSSVRLFAISLISAPFVLDVNLLRSTWFVVVRTGLRFDIACKRYENASPCTALKTCIARSSLRVPSTLSNVGLRRRASVKNNVHFKLTTAFSDGSLQTVPGASLVFINGTVLVSVMTLNRNSCPSVSGADKEKSNPAKKAERT